MTVTSQLAALPACPRAVALGSFDGVHAGHRALLARAAQTGLRTTAVTFDPHPRRLVGTGVQLISSVRRRSELLIQAGAEDVLVTRFTHEVARMSPKEWIATVLKPIGTSQLVVGEGFRFGHRRVGDADTLRNEGIEVLTHEIMAGVSSTRVRDLIAAGELAEAELLLTRPIELEGVLDVALESDSYLLRLLEGSICPPPGRYSGREPSGSVDVAVCADGRVEVFPRPAISARLGDQWCVQLKPSRAPAD